MDPNEQPSWTGGDGPDREKMAQVRTSAVSRDATMICDAQRSDKTDVLD